jgi:tetratricopeptide (TPR) repeat protein
MKKKNQPENSNSGCLLVIGLFFGAVIISVFLLYTNSYENRCIYIAEKSLRDYKNSQAMTILENLKFQIKNKNPKLNFLLFYAYVQTNKLTRAEKLLHNLEEISLDDRIYFQQIINELNTQDEDHMVYELIQKGKKLNLTEDFFIKISEQKKSIIDESSIIELGMEYLKHDQMAVNKLKRYLVRRLLEVEMYLEDSKDSARALKYLEKARKLAIQIEDESFEEQIHYRLGIAYKNNKDFEQAKEHLTLSAKLGNKNAKKLLN